MKMHISIRLILSLLLSLSGAVYTQSNFLWVEDLAGMAADEGLVVNIELVNEDSLAGFQFTLHYNDASLSIDTVVAGERLDGLDAYFSRSAPGQVTVIVFSMAGDAISPGVGPALQLVISIAPGTPAGVEALGMSNIVFSSPGGTTLPGAGLDGYVIVGEINVLRMRNGYLSNKLDLYNHLSIGGLQFTLGYDSNILALDTVLATVRSENMVLDYNEPQPGTVITLLYSDVGDSIFTGSGEVVEFFFNNIQDSSSIVNQLHLSEVTLSSPGGEAVSVEAIDGNRLFITVNNAPGAFTLIDPPENAEGLEPVVNFKWHRSIDPDPLDTIEYILYYAPDWSDTATYTAVEGLVDTTFTATLSNDTEYYWLVEALDQDNLKTASNGGTPQRFVVGTLGVDEQAAIPGQFALHQNYPNPFNPITSIRYDLPQASQVTLTIYDIMGREVYTHAAMEEAGYNSITWQGRSRAGRALPSGIYLYRLVAVPSNGGEGFVATRKMLLLK